MPEVKLIRAQSRHAHFLYSLYEKQEVTRGLGLHRPPPAQFWRNLLTGLYEGWENNFIVMQGQLSVGYIGIQDLSKDDRRGDVIIAIHPDSQRKGLGSAALVELIELCADTAARGGLGLHHLFASVVSDNESSMSMFTKVGFNRAAEIPHYYRFNGTTYSRVVFVRPL